MKIVLISLAITFAIPVFGFLLDCFIRFVLKVLARFTSYKFANMFVTWLTFIGVVHHELSHALFGLITGAKILKITLFKPEGGTLGSVDFIFRGNFVAKALQRTFVSIAPTVCGAITSASLIYLLRVKTLPFYFIVLVVYALVSIVLHMSMSKQDVKIMLKGSYIVFAIVLLIVGGIL